jgi:hypothetical protein
MIQYLRYLSIFCGNVHTHMVVFKNNEKVYKKFQRSMRLQQKAL